MTDRRKAAKEATPSAAPSPAQERRRTSRRAFPRMPVSLWAVEDDGKGIYYHHVADISSGGLFLEKGLLLPVGSRMQLELTLPTARSIRAEGIVVTKVEKRQSGNGIRFVEISEQDRAAIEEYIRSLRP